MKAKVIGRKWVQEWFSECQCNHMPSLTLGYDGTLLAVWCGGKLCWNGDPMGSDCAIWLSRLERGSDKWSVPESIGSDMRYCCHNPVFIKNKKNEIIVMYAKFLDTDRNNSKWCAGRDKLWTRRSTDGGMTWLPARETNIPMLGHPSNDGLLMPDGEMVLAITTGELPERYFGALRILHSYNDGDTWDVGALIFAADGTKMREPAMTLRPDGSIRMFTRACPADLEWGVENYTGKLSSYTTESFDGGRTWTEPEAGSILNNDSKIDLITWSDGSLIMAYNNTRDLDWHERSPLWIAGSSNNGRTWENLAEIAHGPGNKCQPAMCMGTDGLLHVIYMHRHTAVEHVMVEIS
jgi:predicted neuraminidase